MNQVFPSNPSGSQLDVGTAAHAMMQGQKNFKYVFFSTPKKAPALEGAFLSGHLKQLVAAQFAQLLRSQF